MNFFQQISQLNIKGDLVIVIDQSDASNMVVSVMLKNKDNSDPAAKLITPINLSATPKDMDEDFFNTIEAPLQITSQILTNMETYVKQKGLALEKSKMERDKIVKVQKDKTDKERKYEDAIKKAKALEDEGKFREAYVKVPEPDEYPEHADTIRAKREELVKQFEPDLFNS